MARAPTSISQAIRSFAPGEDRTTAVLAAVCIIHRRFAKTVLREVTGVDRIDGESIEANLQVLIPGGRRVDLELVGRRADGSVTRVWIEAKWKAAFQPDQLADYERALDSHGTLIALLPTHRVGEVPDGFRTCTWERIALLADKAGSDDGGPHWRRMAYDPDAPARRRVLALFLDHLQAEHDMTTKPLLTDHAVAIRLADEALEITDRLGDEGIKRAGLQVLKGGSFGYDSAGAWWHLSGRADSDAIWHPRGYLELMRHPQGAHQDGPLEPVFLLGHTLPKATIERLESDQLEDWRRRLAAEEPLFKLSGGRSQLTRIVAAVQIVQIASASASFDGQVSFFAGWIVRALDRLRGLDPGLSWEEL